MLKKHTGTTTDTRGTEFSYTCYTQIEREIDFTQDGWPTIESVGRQYVCNEFPDVKAWTLKELKEKMGAL